MSARSDRILVVGKPYLGDTILALPVLRNLRAAFPNHALDFLVEGGGLTRILAGCPFIDEVLRWERPPRPRREHGLGKRPWLGSLASVEACAATLRPRAYARAYLLNRSLSSALVAVRAGIPHRVGPATITGGPLFTRSARWRAGRHHGDCLLDLLRADRIAVDGAEPRYWGASPAATSRVARLLEALPAGRPRVFIAVRATNWRRQWPLDRWIDAVRRLVADHRCEIVFCGGPEDAAAISALVGSLGAAAAHAHDLSAAVPLDEVPALLARMDLYLGVNSGLMHLAAACGTPGVAIFAAADVARWRPRSERHVIVSGAAGDTRDSGRWLAVRSEPPVDETWAAGSALRAVSVAEVVEHTAACLATRPTAIRRLDLRVGAHRYEVEMREAVRLESTSVAS